MTDLKPCPICGRQPSRNGRMGSGGVVCNGPSVEVAHWVQAYGANQEEADAAWNTRPTSPAPSQVPAHPADMREKVRAAMQDAWDEICDDTGCHPLDISKEGRKTFFRAGHWANLTALRLSGALDSGALLATSAIDGREGDPCHDCGGSGVYFGHTADCDNDSCALNGDMDSCGGEIETCHCALGNSGQVAAATPPKGGQQ